MGRGGGNDEAQRLLYGKPVKIKAAPGQKSAAARASELREDFEGFRSLMIRNTDQSDPETDASDFLADLIHWVRQSRYSEHHLLFDVSQPFYERYRQVQSIAGIHLSRETYLEDVSPERLSPERRKLPEEIRGDSSSARARRMEKEMQDHSLQADQTLALFRIWCDMLELEYSEIEDKAWYHYVAEVSSPSS